MHANMDSLCEFSVFSGYSKHAARAKNCAQKSPKYIPPDCLLLQVSFLLMWSCRMPRFERYYPELCYIVSRSVRSDGSREVSEQKSDCVFQNDFISEIQWYTIKQLSRESNCDSKDKRTLKFVTPLFKFQTRSRLFNCTFIEVPNVKFVEHFVQLVHFHDLRGFEVRSTRGDFLQTFWFLHEFPVPHQFASSADLNACTKK